jgi:hypothetical protein
MTAVACWGDGAAARPGATMHRLHDAPKRVEQCSLSPGIYRGVWRWQVNWRNGLE